MSKRKKHGPHDLFLRNFVLSLLGLAAGYFVLTEVSSWERLPLGQVPYILSGCILIAVSGIVLLYSLKKKYAPKRKKNRAKPVFLKDLKEHASDEKN